MGLVDTSVIEGPSRLETTSIHSGGKEFLIVLDDVEQMPKQCGLRLDFVPDMLQVWVYNVC